jgi:hypothetical protein
MAQVGIRGQVAEDIKALRGIWSANPGGGTEELLEERRRERELEERKAQRRGVGRPR